MTLTFDLLTLKVVSESRVTLATSVLILVFLGLSVLDLGPMYATDVRRASSLNDPAMGAGYNNVRVLYVYGKNAIAFRRISHMHFMTETVFQIKLLHSLRAAVRQPMYSVN